MEDSAILNLSIARFQVILIVLTPLIIFWHYHLLNVIAMKNEGSFILYFVSYSSCLPLPDASLRPTAIFPASIYSRAWLFRSLKCVRGSYWLLCRLVC